MSYSPQQHAILLSLGIEQLPALVDLSHEDEAELEIEQSFTDSLPIRTFPGLPTQKMPVPGKKCPDCLGRGQTVWVIPGKKCQKCGKEVN